jgi:uncharacterized protein YdeI (BOF family)
MGCLNDVQSFRDTTIQIESLNKTDLDDLYWTPQEELDEAPVVIKGEVKKRKEVSFHVSTDGEIPSEITF